jgi:hypothetical protein
MRTAVVLIAFAAMFTGLTVSSYRQDSATMDEPQHLTFGYAALKLGDYRLDIEHPPFLRMWAALPLLAMPDVRFDTNTTLWTTLKPWRFSHKFLYVDNDADRLLNRARFMIVLIGVLLGVLLFCWSRELFGFWPATLVFGLFCFEPTGLAHFGLVTTDAGVTCFIFGTLYFLWRTTRRFSAANLAGFFIFFGLAQISKFSALILGPIMLALLVIYASRSGRWRAAFGVVVAAVLVWYVAVWAAYGFRYAPSPVAGGLDRIVSGPKAHQRLPTLTAIADWVDVHRLLPNTYVQGFALGQAAAQDRTAYLLGEIRFTGWWYYFPVALLVKMPVALIVLSVAGALRCVLNRSKFAEQDAYILLPLVMYLGAAMTMKMNLGVRHVLPIYPFALMLAGKIAAKIFAGDCKVYVAGLAGLCLFQVWEVGAAHRNYVAFFNRLVGGPRNGYRYLGDSNLDLGQDLKRLKLWMQDNGVNHINLSYFGSADPAYYGINCTYLPGSPVFARDKIQDPVLPGLMAVSINNLMGVGLEGNQFYKPLLDAEPLAVVGYSIRVYRVDKPWW